MLFYSDTSQPYGSMSGEATSQAWPQGSSVGNPDTDDEGASRTTGLNVQSTISNVVVGDPGDPYSSGGPVPPVDHVTLTETGRLVASFAEPGPDPSTSNSQNIELDVSHTSDDEVTADNQGPYTLSDISPGGKAITNFSTTSSHNFNIQDPSGGAPNGTITISFVLDLKQVTPRFGQEASLNFQSTHRNATLSDDQLTIVDPTTSTVLYSASDFEYGHVAIQITVPAFTHESISASSTYGTYPLGTFNDGAAAQYGSFSYSFAESIT